MRLRLRVVALLSCLVVAAAARMAAAEDAGSFDPAQGAVVGGVYVNAYFGLRYPLPEGWSAGPKPPAPSYAGYYVLATPAPPEGAQATALIAAQDIFFAAPPIADARAMTEGLAKNAATADSGPARAVERGDRRSQLCSARCSPAARSRGSCWQPTCAAMW